MESRRLMLIAAWWLVWLVWLVGGCAAIQVTETVTNTPLSAKVRVEVDPDSIEYDIRGDVAEFSIIASVDQRETCTTVITPRTHRVRYRRKVADPTLHRTMWALAVGGIVAGGYSAVNAESFALNPPFVNSPAQTVDEYRTYGGVLAGTGFAIGVMAIVDAIRAADEVVDDGAIAGRATSQQANCREAKARNLPVVLTLADGQTVSARLDDKGAATFSLLAVPEVGLPERAPRLSVVVGGVRLELEVSTWSDLRSRLLAEPRSRLALDVLARRRAQCAQRLDAARALQLGVTDGALDQEQAGWTEARGICAELWTSAHESESAAVATRINAKRCGLRLGEISGQLATKSPDLDVEMLGVHLDGALGVCAAAGREADVRRLVGAVDVIVVQREKARVEQARRLLAAEARDERRRVEAERRRVRAERAERPRSYSPRPARVQSWGGARLLCNDGTLSPTCTCGRGSYRGCCSHHGGVSSCSVSPD